MTEETREQQRREEESMTKVSEVLRQILAERNITPEELVEAVMLQVRRYAPADFSREEVEKIVEGTATTRGRVFYFVVYVNRGLGLDEAEVGRLLWAVYEDMERYCRGPVPFELIA